jgi:hypothetical protein
MPSTVKDVRKFFERIAILETQVKELMTWQKWQMGILAAILAAVVLRRL